MSGRKAKALRRQARTLTPGIPERGYVGTDYYRKLAKSGSDGRPVTITLSTYQLHPLCTRAVYRALKRAA